METFEEKLQQDLHQFLCNMQEVDELMPQCPDVEDKWESIARAYIPDGIREFSGYPTVSLGWMMYIGMAVARFWDEDWSLYNYKNDLYAFMRDKRGYDHMDEYIREEVLQLDGTKSIALERADHGSMYQLDYQHPMFFRMPLLMLGGAVKESKTYDMFVSQSDMVGTLLAQMQISCKDYPWSRNVLSKNYSYPFVYSTYPSGMLYADSTGVTMMDLQSGCVVYSEGDEAESRVLRTKAILQRSYDKLKEINIEH